MLSCLFTFSVNKIPPIKKAYTCAYKKTYTIVDSHQMVHILRPLRKLRKLL